MRTTVRKKEHRKPFPTILPSTTLVSRAIRILRVRVGGARKGKLPPAPPFHCARPRRALAKYVWPARLPLRMRVGKPHPPIKSTVVRDMASTKISPTAVVAALDELTTEKAKELFFHLKVQLKTLDDIDTNHAGNMRKIRTSRPGLTRRWRPVGRRLWLASN